MMINTKAIEEVKQAISAAGESEVFLVIDANDLDRIQGLLKTLEPDEIKKLETPDNDYLFFHWTFVFWSDYWNVFGNDADKSSSLNQLRRKLYDIRHSLVEITEDGTVFRDVVESDSHGIDEEFSEIMDPQTRIYVWNAGIEDLDNVSLFNGR